jgi:hypothetical protein
VDHPRWSQATERRIGEDGLFAKKRPTLMFNGYEAQVGSCTPAWTCGRTTDVRALKPRRLRRPARPLAWLVFGAATDRLGANPAEALIRSTGDWTLRLLCATLAVTPLRQWTGWHVLARLRRMLGVGHLLLRHAAPAVLRLARHGAGCGRDRARHRQAPLHPGGHRRAGC